MKAEPEATVVLVASEGVKSIARILSRLESQTASTRIEVIIAASASTVPELVRLPKVNFVNLRVVEADLSTSARARATGVTHASAPLVIFTEDHAFPKSKDWAALLISAHRLPHVAVGPVIRNANPATATSWASLVVEYGPWLDATQPIEMDYLPGHNSAYKRSALVAYGDDLANMLEAEWVLHRDLRARGETLWLDPSIEVEHVNYSTAGPALKLHVLEGWMFAASRSRSWSGQKRLIYAAAFPAIVLRRFYKVVQQLFQSPSSRPHAMRALPMSALLLLASGLGEGIGYTFGDGGYRSALARMEYYRWRNVLLEETNILL